MISWNNLFAGGWKQDFPKITKNMKNFLWYFASFSAETPFRMMQKFPGKNKKQGVEIENMAIWLYRTVKKVQDFC
jgi:hypothetical protein